MTLDLDNMTQAEFDGLMVDLKENEPICSSLSLVLSIKKYLSRK